MLKVLIWAHTQKGPSLKGSQYSIRQCMVHELISQDRRVAVVVEWPNSCGINFNGKWYPAPSDAQKAMGQAELLFINQAGFPQ